MFHLDPQLFWSTFALIFFSELPDKTAFATLLLATRKSPFAIFIGVAAAFVIQSVVAVSFGSALAMLPEIWVRVGAGILFLIFAVAMWLRKEDKETAETERSHHHTFLNTVFSSFVVISIAEWGDLTQLATATLQAKYNSPFTIVTAAILALWCVTAIAIVVGNRAKKVIQPVLLQKIAAGAFALVGVIFIFKAFV